MAFTGNFMATSFKQEILEGVHDFRLTGGDTFKLALYDNSASLLRRPRRIPRRTKSATPAATPLVVGI